MKSTLALWLLFFAGSGAAVEIRNVQHDPAVFDTQKNEAVMVRFSLSDPATVTLTIYDGRDLMIRALITENILPAGDHVLEWLGKDQLGRPVPPGAYHYTLYAITPSGEHVEHDLTDLTGGEDIDVEAVDWDPEKGQISYVLTSNAMVNIRFGLKNDGPLLRTLLNWVPRAGGLQREDWDGMDESAALDLTRHPQLLTAAQAFSLSDNTILVDPVAKQVRLVEDITWGESRREVKQQSKKRMYAHAQQTLETRGDFSIELKLPEGLKYDKSGVPLLSGTVPVRLDIEQKDRTRALSRRFEPVFFLDGVYVFENETGFLPMTWNWDTANASPGVHYLTANLRGYEGNFGIATLKVRVVARDGDN